MEEISLYGCASCSSTSKCTFELLDAPARKPSSTAKWMPLNEAGRPRKIPTGCLFVRPSVRLQRNFALRRIFRQLLGGGGGKGTVFPRNQEMKWPMRKSD